MVRDFLSYENIEVTPLHTAVQSCDTDNVKNLLKKSVSDTVEIDIITPKHHTAPPTQTRLNKVRNLLKSISSRKLLDKSMFKKIAKQLYTDTEKFDSITATPLHKATESHDLEKVRDVLGHAEYSVDTTDSVGWTPLHYACAAGNLDMVRMLIC